MSYDRLPDQITGPMTTSQARTLRSLAVEAYQEKLFHHMIVLIGQRNALGGYERMLNVEGKAQGGLPGPEPETHQGCRGPPWMSLDL
jgi:hypothetical protein